METPIESQPPNQPTPQNRHPQKPQRGVALILVVSFIVLISALVVGFFSRVQTDLAGARSYSEGVSVRQLADSAVGVVMGQIRSATTVENAAWASQPGMIRTYRTASGSAGAQAYAFYKLYSSPNLVVSGQDIANFESTTSKNASSPKAEVPMGIGGWLKQPAFFTDINEPVDVPNPTNPAPNSTVKRYPVFDPSVARIPSINQHPASNPAGSVEGDAAEGGATDGAREVAVGA